MNKKYATKTALALSLCMMIVWLFLGAGTSIAWFMDETPVAKNTFDIGILDLEVSHKVGTGYQKVKQDTKLFDDKAIYEPGYTQIVRLKIENKGDIPFDYKLSVVPDLQTLVTAVSVKNNTIILPDYLRFGVVVANTESELDTFVAQRTLARKYATLPLSSYSEANPYITDENHALEPDKEAYAAVIVWMPETVGNEANYRGNIPPQVDLDISVKAAQQGTAQ